MALPMPELEGKYEILEKIREGGMGAIYKVRHRLLDEVRVIKVMRPSVEKNDELRAVDRFVREARIAIKLRHPNIAQLYDFSSDEQGNGLIVMEFIDGLTLDEILDHSGPPSAGLATEIATQSLEALGTLHENGFVHRDISPDNLMLTRDVRGRSLVKLIDLGIAKMIQDDESESVTKTGTFLGKYKYAAPEMFQDSTGTGVDRRSDLYSFGIVFYKLLTNQHPITGEDVSSVIAGHLFRDPVDFAESDPENKIPQPLRDVVLKALAKKPEDRYQDAEEMVVALEEVQKELDLVEDTEEVQELIDLRDRLRAEHAQKAGTGTQAAIDDLFPANETRVNEDDDDGTVLLSPDSVSELETAATRMMSSPAEGLADSKVEAQKKGKGDPKRSETKSKTPAAAGAPRKFNPIVGIAAAAVLLLVALVVVFAMGGDEEPADVAAATATEMPPIVESEDSAESGEETPVRDLLGIAVAAAAADDWDLAAEKLTELDALANQTGPDAVTVTPEMLSEIAAVREDVLQANLEQATETLQSALLGADLATLQATLGRITAREEQALLEDEERAEIYNAAKQAAATMTRFEAALASPEPERALSVAFEIASSEPELAQAMNAKDRAARNLESRIDLAMSEGNYDVASASAQALREVWAERPGLMERIERIDRMSNMSQRAEDIFAEVERTLETGRPHLGLQMLAGRQVPVPFQDQMRELRARLQADLNSRDQEAPKFEFDDANDVAFEKESPAVIRMKVVDDYMVVGVEAKAENRAGEERTLKAVPLGGGTYRVTVPPEFHQDGTFKFWAVAFDHSRNEGLLGAEDRPLEIKRKRWFRKRRG